MFLNIHTGPCNEVSVEESTETVHEPFLDDMEHEASQEASTAKMTDEDPTWTPDEIDIAFQKTDDNDDNDGSEECEKPSIYTPRASPQTLVNNLNICT